MYVVTNSVGDVHNVNVLVRHCSCHKANDCAVVSSVQILHTNQSAAQRTPSAKAQLFWLSTGSLKKFKYALRSFAIVFQIQSIPIEINIIEFLL